MTKQVRKLDTPGDIMGFVMSIAEEAVRKSLIESGIFEDDAPASPTQADGDASQQAPAEPKKPAEPNPYAAKQHPEENIEEPTIDMVVDKLNSIRSGHSFRDTSVKGSMEQYFNKLSTEERSALLTFLKAISQIVTGEVPGQSAPDPHESPSNLKITKSGESGKKVKNVTVIKAPQKDQTKKGTEDTSAPAPIRPRAK